MSTYIVTYDLNAGGQNYECIHNKLRAYGTYLHLQESVWIIKTDSKSRQIWNNLSSCLDDNDELFICDLGRDATWSGKSEKVTNWLRDSLTETVF